MNLKERIIRYALCAAMTFLMCFTAELLCEKEIIFPEIAALTIGAWLVPKSPWKVSRPRLVIVMTIAAFAGIAIMRFVPLAMPLKLLIGFLFTAICLLVSHTTMVPVISACILPIMMGTESVVYPVSVCIMSVIIVLVNLMLEKMGYNQKLDFHSEKINIKENILLWTKRFVIFSAALLPAVISGEFLLLAPPLIVTFVEFTDYSPAKKPIRTFFVISCAAIIGFSTRCLCQFASVPLWICAVIAIILVIIVFEILKRKFPPAGAIALLPLIISDEKIFVYPIAVIIGCAMLIGLAVLFFKDEKNNA